jgi:Fe-Mn family superoxide dismutase
VEDGVGQARLAPVFVNGLKREELIATNSMILHELYSDGLGDGGAPDSPLCEVLTQDFGSLDRWRTEFVAMGNVVRLHEAHAR